MDTGDHCDLQASFFSFRVNQWVNDFLWQLLYMMNKKQSTDPEELSEGMFQELFLRFAKLFELKLV